MTWKGYGMGGMGWKMWYDVVCGGRGGMDGMDGMTWNGVEWVELFGGN
jgi:hypothetical protein